jgi:hypothetical protein
MEQLIHGQHIEEGRSVIRDGRLLAANAEMLQDPKGDERVAEEAHAEQ